MVRCNGQNQNTSPTVHINISKLKHQQTGKPKAEHTDLNVKRGRLAAPGLKHGVLC